MKRRWSSTVQLVSTKVDDCSSSEVTSSSAALVMSPANSLASTDIDVDLVEFWDLDINSANRVSVLQQNGYIGGGSSIGGGNGVQGQTVISTSHHTKSDTSSMSGRSQTRQLIESVFVHSQHYNKHSTGAVTLIHCNLYFNAIIKLLLMLDIVSIM